MRSSARSCETSTRLPSYSDSARVSAWLERLCAVLARNALPLLATLTVDGRREWSPALPIDAQVDGSFAQHQSGDKGLGAALGGLAATVFAERLAAHGYTVSSAPSDWRISPEHPDMLLQMLDESIAVAGEIEPAATEIFASWARARHAQLAGGALSLVIGHVDLLGIPGR